MAAYRIAQSPAPSAPPTVSSFAEELFAHLPRADQRRWAESYLHGLLVTPGKKTMRRLAAAVSSSPTACQSLQQFVNASPWDWGPARHQLTRWIEAQQPTRAWTIAPVVLPKRGSHSVGVHRRFVPALGRTVNCQLALGLFHSTDGEHLPSDWRLLLPDQWTQDPELRDRARIPTPARHRPLWATALDLVTTTATRSTLPPVPVVADMAQLSDGPLLAGALNARGKDFLIAIHDHTNVIPKTPHSHHPTHPATLTARHALNPHHARHPRTTAHPDTHPRRTHVISTLVQLPTAQTATSHPRPTYRLFTQQQTNNLPPAPVWLTNMTHHRISELLPLTQLPAQTNSTIHTLQNNYGLHDHEGRSYPGWHHHMTLLSAAYTYNQLNQQAATADRWSRTDTDRNTGISDTPHPEYVGSSAPARQGDREAHLR